MIGFSINLVAVMINVGLGLAFGFTPIVLGCIVFSMFIAMFCLSMEF